MEAEEIFCRLCRTKVLKNCRAITTKASEKILLYYGLDVERDINQTTKNLCHRCYSYLIVPRHKNLLPKKITGNDGLSEAQIEIVTDRDFSACPENLPPPPRGAIPAANIIAESLQAAFPPRKSQSRPNQNESGKPKPNQSCSAKPRSSNSSTVRPPDDYGQGSSTSRSSSSRKRLESMIIPSFDKTKTAFSTQDSHTVNITRKSVTVENNALGPSITLDTLDNVSEITTLNSPAQNVSASNDDTNLIFSPQTRERTSTDIPKKICRLCYKKSLLKTKKTWKNVILKITQVYNVDVTLDEKHLPMFICATCYANLRLRPAKLPPMILNNFGTNSVPRCEILSKDRDKAPQENDGESSSLPGKQKDADVVEQNKVCSICMMRKKTDLRKISSEKNKIVEELYGVPVNKHDMICLKCTFALGKRNLKNLPIEILKGAGNINNYKGIYDDEGGEGQGEDGQHPRALVPSEEMTTSQPTRSIIDINTEENFHDGGQSNSDGLQSPCIGNKTPPQPSLQVDLPDTAEKITLTPPPPSYSESSDEEERIDRNLSSRKLFQNPKRPASPPTTRKSSSSDEDLEIGDHEKVSARAPIDLGVDGSWKVDQLHLLTCRLCSEKFINLDDRRRVMKIYELLLKNHGINLKWDKPWYPIYAHRKCIIQVERQTLKGHRIPKALIFMHPQDPDISETNSSFSSNSPILTPITPRSPERSPGPSKRKDLLNLKIMRGKNRKPTKHRPQIKKMFKTLKKDCLRMDEKMEEVLFFWLYEMLSAEGKHKKAKELFKVYENQPVKKMSVRRAVANKIFGGRSRRKQIELGQFFKAHFMDIFPSDFEQDIATQK